MCALTLSHIHARTNTHQPFTKPCALIWHHHGEMDCHDFMVNCQILPLSVFPGMKREDVVLKGGVSVLPAVSTYHMAWACADHWGSAIGPSIHHSPWEQQRELGSQTTESMAVCPCVSMCMHAKKAMQKLPWEHFSAITCPPALNTNIGGKVIQNTMIYATLSNFLRVFLKARVTLNLFLHVIVNIWLWIYLIVFLKVLSSLTFMLILQRSFHCCCVWVLVRTMADQCADCHFNCF